MELPGRRKRARLKRKLMDRVTGDMKGGRCKKSDELEKESAV